MAASVRVVRPRHASRPLRRRVLSVIGTSVAAIVGFSAVSGAAYMQLTMGSMETHDVDSLVRSDPDSTVAPQDEVPTDFAANKPINIAIIGSDQRDGVNAEIGGAAHHTTMLNDVTMVMHISADRERIEVVSIPRDSRVRISDCKMYDGSTVRGWTGRINTALANGGKNGNRGEAAACVMRTITDATGVEFNGHFMMVDFNGFQNMVDAIDGIPMCVPRDMRSAKANLDLEAGPQVLDGETALAFARARTGTGLGDGTDLMRINRQQELLENTARKALGMNLLTDVPQLTQFVRAGAESLTLDDSLASINNIVGLGYSLRDFDTANLTFATVPWEYAGDGTGHVLWKEEEAAAMWQSIVDDVPLVLPSDDEAELDELVPDPVTTPGVTAAAATDSGSATSDATGSGATGSTDSTPDVASRASEPAPATASEPARESQEDILASCVVD